MPKALGEFGKAANSDVTHKVMGIIDAAHAPLGMQAIWKCVHTDLAKLPALVEILGNLQVADKIQVVQGGYLPKKKVRDEGIPGAVDWSILTKLERDMI